MAGACHRCCALQHRSLLVRSRRGGVQSASVIRLAADMAAASGGSLVSGVVACDAHFGVKEVRSVRNFSGQRQGNFSGGFLGAVRHSSNSRFPLYRANDKHFVRKWSGPIQALDDMKTQESTESKEEGQSNTSTDSTGNNGAITKEAFPSGDLQYAEFGGWDQFLTKCRMLFALPWQRIKKGSVLKLKLAGSVTEQVAGRFSQGLSLPVICQNLIKAAHDPRVAGVVLRIEPLDCGWGKVDEICRHIDYYKKSGNSSMSFVISSGGQEKRKVKNAMRWRRVLICQVLNLFAGKILMGFLVVAGEKEYYLACKCGEIYAPPGAYISLLGLKVQATFLGGVLEKIGVEPQIQRIGKYKSAGDSLARKDMSEANREMLTALLDDIYENWIDHVSSSRGKTRKDVEDLLDAGIFELPKLKEGGWITDIKYEDELDDMLKQKLGLEGDKKPPTVDYKRYSKVKEWTLGLSGGGERIAVIRAVGSISRARGGIGLSSEGIVSDTFIEKIRQVRDAKEFKAVILRIDSPGGDALASDLMWREIKLLAAKKPVIASMVDVAASGGYYMAMACGVIIAESLTLTGSIGVITGKFNLGELYERVGFNKEIISRGRFAELDAEQRSFKPEELEYFKSSAMNSYKSFRDKAALSRSMEEEKMEEIAQGRVWTGKAAAERGLVDALGGFSRAVAIAKEKAGISSDAKVSLVEFTRQQPSPFEVLRSGASLAFTLIELAGSEQGQMLFDFLVRGAKLPAEISSSRGIQARMDDIIIDGLGLEDRQDRYL